MNIRGTNDDVEDEPQLKELTPVLDDALQRLSESDREAILLRFFRGLSLRDTGTALGTTEEAARKRVSRALDKLNSIFKRKGVVMPTALLAMGVAVARPFSGPAAPAWAVFLGQPLVFEFVFGMGVALALRSGARLSAWLAGVIALVAALTMFWMATTETRLASAGLPAMPAIAACQRAGSRASNP